MRGKWWTVVRFGRKSGRGHFQSTTVPRGKRGCAPEKLPKTQCIPTFCPPPTSPGTQPPMASGGLSLSLSLSLKRNVARAERARPLVFASVANRDVHSLHEP